MKAIITLGYTDYVMDAEAAAQIAAALTEAEHYKSRYRAGGKSTHHIWRNHEVSDVMHVKYISDQTYNMYKLAGAPEE